MKSIADFAVRRRQISLIIFCRGVYVAKNTSRGATCRSCRLTGNKTPKRSASLLRKSLKDFCVRIASSAVSHRAGALAAHGQSLLMLLGSPPDMIRGHPLRETGSAACRGGLIPSIIHQKTAFGNYEFTSWGCIFTNLGYNIICMIMTA